MSCLATFTARDPELAELLARHPVVADLIDEAIQVRRWTEDDETRENREIALFREWSAPRGLRDAVCAAVPRRSVAFGPYRIYQAAFGPDQGRVERAVYLALLGVYPFTDGEIKVRAPRSPDGGLGRRLRKNLRNKERQRLLRLARREAQEAREGTGSTAVTPT